METYYSSAKGQKITLKRALQEIRRHDASEKEFLAENGEKSEYDAQDVLNWLGY